jgi:4-hydroxy-3-polyprenylbenzoate decarboxylase
MSKPDIETEATTGFVGLREFLELVDDIGELERVTGASWDREMSAISELTARGDRDPMPALLFDDIADYPSGYRALYGQTNSLNRLALTVGMAPEYEHAIDFLADYREKADEIEHGDSTEPAFVDPDDAPVFEHSMTGDDVDVLSLPVPLHHEHDGGRYIGTGDCVITRNPSSGRINLGTYRMQVFDEQHTGLYISPGKHGRMDVDDWFDAGEDRVPVAASVGQDPTLWMFSSISVTHDSTYGEYARAGGLKGRPFPVVEGPVTGLPLPAHGEIVLEGYLERGNVQEEGPFGEWTGYYGSGASDSPVFQVEAIHHRDDPILACAVPAKPPYDYSYHKSLARSANLWDQVEAAGVPDVRGVWRTEAGGSRLFNIVSIKQRYAGHARQAGYIAAQVQAGAYAGRWTVVVDKDIDPTNLDEVAWAMSTRCDPTQDIETFDRAWSTPLDPMIPDAEKEHPFNSRAIVDATIPYERRDEFPRVAETSPDYQAEIREKWDAVISGSSP